MSAGGAVELDVRHGPRGDRTTPSLMNGKVPIGDARQVDDDPVAHVAAGHAAAGAARDQRHAFSAGPADELHEIRDIGGDGDGRGDDAVDAGTLGVHGARREVRPVRSTQSG